jgi:hypothetical protein
LSGIESKKELRLRITSTSGKRYQVFQRLSEPVINEKGQALNPQALETAAYANSNTSGTLYLQNIDRMGYGDQLLYTSAQNGESDSFVIGYFLRQDLFNVGGKFMGKLAFTVRSIGDNSQDQVMVNIFLDGESDWRAKVAGDQVPDLVRVKDSDTFDNAADHVRISFEGNGGSEIRVYQEIDTFPRNENSEELASGVLRFLASGDQAAHLRAVSPQAMERRSVLLYSGRPERDVFGVHFMMDPEELKKQSAGTYHGRLKYIIERDDSREEFFIKLECRIQPVFALNADVPAGGVSFNNVLATNPPQDKEIEVQVISNLHKPYQVLQNLLTPMANEKGEEISKEYFSLKVEIPAGQKGRTKFKDFSPMETGDHPIFSSDAQGGPVSFKVIYRLQGYPQMSGGNFRAPIRYSLDQN